MSVSSNVVKLRERRGLNQKELAESLGMNRSVLNRIENGTRPVRDDELKLFADYFNVSADYLLGRDATKATPLSDEQATLLKDFGSKVVGRRVKFSARVTCGDFVTWGACMGVFFYF